MRRGSQKIEPILRLSVPMCPIQLLKKLIFKDFRLLTMFLSKGRGGLEETSTGRFLGKIDLSLPLINIIQTKGIFYN